MLRGVTLRRQTLAVAALLAAELACWIVPPRGGNTIVTVVAVWVMVAMSALGMTSLASMAAVALLIFAQKALPAGSASRAYGVLG